MAVTRVDGVKNTSNGCTQLVQVSRPAILSQHRTDCVTLAKRVTVLLQERLIEQLRRHHPEHSGPASEKHLDDFPHAT